MAEMHHNFEISICDPSKNKMGYFMLIQHAWENPSERKGLNLAIFSMLQVKENDELTAICDELIAKVGGD